MSEFFDTSLMCSSDPDERAKREIAGMFDAPAYVRRALRMQEAVELVRKKCRQQRAEWLEGVALRLRQWLAVVRDDPEAWQAATPAAVRVIDELASLGLMEDAALRARAQARPKEALRNLGESVERFNRRWRRYTENLDTHAANQAIDGYNEHYLFEKECAFRSRRAAQLGYEPHERLDPLWLQTEFPFLPAWAEDRPAAGSPVLKTLLRGLRFFRDEAPAAPPSVDQQIEPGPTS